MWKRLLLVLLLLASPARSATTPAPTEITPEGRWEDLGVPVRRCRIYSQAVGRDTRGREVYYLGFGTSEGSVLALDPRTGKGKQLDLLGHIGCVWGLCAHSSGKAYAALGSGPIFEIDAAAGEVRLLGMPPEGESVAWELWEAADGNLYGFKGTHLVRFRSDPLTEEPSRPPITRD